MTTDTTTIDPEVDGLITASRNAQSWDEAEHRNDERMKHWENRETILAHSITSRLAKPSADTIEREMQAVLDAWANESRYHNYIAGDEPTLITMLTDRVFELLEGRIEE